jgi:hypothetical protein
MNVEHLHIITMNTDDMVRKSALGFLYKYMMRADIKSITLVHLEGATGEHFFLNRFTRDADGIRWVDQPTGKWRESEKEFDASVHPEHAAELEKLIVQRVQAERKAVEEQKPTYQRNHTNGAIVVVHGTTTDINGIQPELLAKVFVKLINDKVFPIFDKIVFNACRIGKTLTQKTQVEGRLAYWDYSTRKGQKRTRDKPAVQPSHVFTFNPQTTKEYEAPLSTPEDLIPVENDLLVTQITIDMGFYNCVYRFLNVYGKLCGNDKVMVAGYDDALTAAHPHKGNKNTEFAALENSGRKYLLEPQSSVPKSWMKPEHKFAYMFTRNTDGSIISELEPSGWSDKAVRK